jgi:Ca2+-binding RTX toxin-like protein
MTRKTQTKSPVVAEVLESKVMLSAVSLEAGTLTVDGNNRDNNIVVTQDADNVLVNVDGKLSTFDAALVTNLKINGGDSNDVLENRTNLNAILNGGDGNDILRGGGGNDVLIGDNGKDILNDSGGNNVLDGGNGNDTLQSVSSGRDVFIGGNGDDFIYAIVGEPNVAIGGNGNDSFIVRAGVEQTDAERGERVVAFAADAPGTLRNGVLYVGLGTGGNIRLSQQGNTLIANINGDIFKYDARKVDVIAGVGSSGDDVFINATNIDSVYYGSAGNDVLIGGGGNDLLKGGSGDDVLIGNDGNDDIAGDSGVDVIIGGSGKDKLRFDLLDWVFSDNKDILIYQ